MKFSFKVTNGTQITSSADTNGYMYHCHHLRFSEITNSNTSADYFRVLSKKSCKMVRNTFSWLPNYQRKGEEDQERISERKKNINHMVCSNGSNHCKFFKGCLPQVLLGPFLNTLSLHNSNNTTREIVWKYLALLMTSIMVPGGSRASICKAVVFRGHLNWKNCQVGILKELNFRTWCWKYK